MDVGMWYGKEKARESTKLKMCSEIKSVEKNCPPLPAFLSKPVNQKRSPESS